MPSSFLIKYPKTACVINSTQPKIIKFLPCLWFHSVTFVSSSLRSGFSPVFIDTGFSDLYCIIPIMIKISETNNEIMRNNCSSHIYPPIIQLLFALFKCLRQYLSLFICIYFYLTTTFLIPSPLSTIVASALSDSVCFLFFAFSICRQRSYS